MLGNISWAAEDFMGFPVMLLDFIKNAYDTFEQYHVSITALIAVTLVLFIAFLFAMREAAAWFFKIDDIKRDIRKLHDLTVELESEVRTLQDIVANGPQASSPNTQAKTTTNKSVSFPFNH
jgi:hypothetical protein